MSISRKIVAYYRVSTAKQGISGLGLEAQEQTVRNYLSTGNFEVIASFTEVETGGGANALEKRPQLKAALGLAKKHKATLCIAALSRLARNVHFISGLLETGVEFIDASMPNADRFMIQIYSVMSELEKTQISTRTKLALAAAKARGVQLGRMGAANLKRKNEEQQQAADEFAAKLARIIKGFRADGLSQRAMVAELNAMSIPTVRGGQWQLTQLRRMLARIDAQAANDATANVAA
ncbi:recombinase family protein [Paraburkholderia fungorum]|uniref:recombinase family protein n=1 Tax=Paraburkholderia fungorum TaxID=134537 RepID=UPI0038B98F9C